LFKFASSHAVPLKLPEPGTPPISIETLALAVWRVFHVTTAVFVINDDLSTAGAGRLTFVTHLQR